jgi:hypothetical protein
MVTEYFKFLNILVYFLLLIAIKYNTRSSSVHNRSILLININKILNKNLN